MIAGDFDIGGPVVEEAPAHEVIPEHQIHGDGVRHTTIAYHTRFMGGRICDLPPYSLATAARAIRYADPGILPFALIRELLTGKYVRHTNEKALHNTLAGRS